MERQQEEMQYMGLFGIYKESCKLIFKWRKIFTQIALTLILPLCIIFLAQQKISQILFRRLVSHNSLLEDTPAGAPDHKSLSHLVSSDIASFVLFKIAYFTFLLVFSLLSTSAVVYTVASIYTSREVTFKKVMRVVPKVWKRLMVTFLCTFLTLVLYTLVLVAIIVSWLVITQLHPSTFGIVVFCVLLVVYAVGFVYMTVIWQLSSVVTVLEDSYGFKAMVKSKKLIKGKLVVSVIIFVKLIVALVFVDLFFRIYALYSYSGVVRMVGFGVLCFLLLFVLILFVLVVQTVIYFVCKSYHHETIDKSALSEHLEVYLGDYVRLRPNKEVQMEAVANDQHV